ncbi:MAG: hypothetical protein EPN79_15685 [Burkholderiaceae bacterium]|nr:MAG: hypothetical protein EPN79_15685 [Burkholderiaceae bacterium]
MSIASLPDHVVATHFRPLPNSSGALQAISSLVRQRLLAEAPPLWREAVQEYEDERNYMTLALATFPGNVTPMLTIELGVQHGAHRHATGIFMASWRRAETVIGPVSTVLLDGDTAEITAFVARMNTFLDLPETFADFAEHAA